MLLTTGCFCSFLTGSELNLEVTDEDDPRYLCAFRSYLPFFRADIGSFQSGSSGF